MLKMFMTKITKIYNKYFKTKILKCFFVLGVCNLDLYCNTEIA